ncbi:MAG: hypothetical protein Q9182_001543 [Xanthomendoza sp. 2 TL-2023]
MPNSRSARTLSKNQDSLKELADHLRPGGSYDPLPPPGGFPLPAYIRRKFSFAPQLPNVSKISLMPDFASSSLDLGIPLDKSEARGISFDTPVSLWVHYSPEVHARKNVIERQQPDLRSSLPRIDTNPAIGNIEYHLSDAVNIASHEDRHSRHSNHRRPQSIRRSCGQESLRLETASTARSSQKSECSLSPYPHRSGMATPATIFSSVEEEMYGTASPCDQGESAYATHFSNANAAESRLLRRLAETCPNLLGSFCIIDLQLPGYPIRVTSHDMLPVDLAPDEVLYLDQSDMGAPYKIKTASNGKKELRILPIVADLMDIHASSARPSHLVVGQIDLTDLLQSLPDLDEDVWLTIAYEEMAKAGIRRTYRVRDSPTKDAHPRETEQAIELIRSLHRDYFIIGMSNADRKEFGITMVSPTLYASKEVRGKYFLDFAKLSSRLKIPQRFVTRVKWQTPGLRNKLYCVPMSGPHLVCWLCFLVDSDFPDIWP